MFIEKTLQLLKKDSILSLITTFRFTQTKYGEEIKRLILEKHWLKKLVNFGTNRKFKMINKIILASKSGERKKILKKNNINCEVIPANIDEESVKESLIKENATP